MYSVFLASEHFRLSQFLGFFSPSFLRGRQGRRYDSIVQIGRLKLMEFNKGASEVAKVGGPEAWSRHLGPCPSQPVTLTASRGWCSKGLSNPEAQSCPECTLGHLRIFCTAVSTIFLLPSFLSSAQREREREKLLLPRWSQLIFSEDFGSQRPV